MNETQSKLIAAAEVLPDNWTVVVACGHPLGPNTPGVLARNTSTGIYAHFSAGIMRTVPQGWARKVALAKLGVFA